jgi:phosphatidylserine decarboxylase
MLTPYGRTQWITILVVTAGLCAWTGYLHCWWGVGLVIFFSLAALSFFRDPNRTIPVQQGILVSPADGRISSIHELQHYEPLGEAALCIRVFLSVADVHVNRSPCHGKVMSVTPRPGLYLNALKPESAEVNEANTIVLMHPIKKTPIVAIRQIAGLIARTIVCPIDVGDTLQRGQRFGMIKFGSTTELYIPMSSRPKPLVRQGQYVWGGETIMATVSAEAGVDLDPPAGG